MTLSSACWYSVEASFAWERPQSDAHYLSLGFRDDKSCCCCVNHWLICWEAVCMSNALYLDLHGSLGCNKYKGGKIYSS